jgi:hypothetical protein
MTGVKVPVAPDGGLFAAAGKIHFIETVSLEGLEN